MTPRQVVIQPDGKPLVVGEAPSAIVLWRLDRSDALDPSFGNGGVVGVPAFGQPAAALLPDGRIVLAGFSSSGHHQPFVARLAANGGA
jgi:hypothetical protein